jgi:hypothetical protein
MPLPRDTIFPRDNLFPGDTDEETGVAINRTYDRLAAIRRDDEDMLMIISNFARML